MPTKSKPTSRTKTGSKNKKSKISTKLVAAIVIGIVAIAGVVIVSSSFAKSKKTCKTYYSPWRLQSKNVKINGEWAKVKTGYTRQKTVQCKNEKPAVSIEYRR